MHIIVSSKETVHIQHSMNICTVSQSELKHKFEI